LPDTAAEEANTSGIHFRRNSLTRLILRGTGRQPRRAHSAPLTSLNESVARLHLKESVTRLEAVDQLYDNFELPESTYTFLITEPILSLPFAVGCIAYAVVS
jgi:S-adenosylmethionine:tRNA-ribosyltransferase-isomerase (queuine synthetase)